MQQHPASGLEESNQGYHPGMASSGRTPIPATGYPRRLCTTRLGTEDQ